MEQPTRGIATGNGVLLLPDNLGFYALTSAYLLDSNNEPLLKMRVEPKLLITQDRNALLLEAKRFITDKNTSMNSNSELSFIDCPFVNK